ncbi:MAG: ABC transporter permease subunit [Deltaproteobacteria bacterium]|nr:ABC transporter permease subunit [Deltaproteobacteria bacterium]
MRRGLGATAALLLAAAVLLPLWLVVKQAVTPEAESVAWPPTWWPAAPTLANFRLLLASVELASGLRLSLLVGGLTVLSTLAVSFPAAWVAARRPAVDRPLDALLLLARVFPAIALAVPLAVLFVQLGLYNDPGGRGLWLAHTLLATPFAFFILRAGIRRVPSELEDAAQLDGASRAGAVWRVTVPLAAPSIAAAALLVFLVSWDEFAYALVLQVTNRPLPPLLYYFAAFSYPGAASALAALMLLPALLIVALLAPAIRAGGLRGSGR